MDQNQMNQQGMPPAATPPKGQTSMGMGENVEGALAYLLGFVTGIVFLLVEKHNRFVRFHAFQSIAISVVLIILSYVLNFIPFLWMLTSWLLPLLELLLLLLLLYKAYNGEMYKLPLVGDFAEKQANK